MANNMNKIQRYASIILVLFSCFVFGSCNKDDSSNETEEFSVALSENDDDKYSRDVVIKDYSKDQQLKWKVFFQKDISSDYFRIYPTEGKGSGSFTVRLTATNSKNEEIFDCPIDIFLETASGKTSRVSYHVSFQHLKPLNPNSNENSNENTNNNSNDTPYNSEKTYYVKYEMKVDYGRNDKAFRLKIEYISEKGPSTVTKDLTRKSKYTWDGTYGPFKKGQTVTLDCNSDIGEYPKNMYSGVGDYEGRIYVKEDNGEYVIKSEGTSSYTSGPGLIFSKGLHIKYTL